jgi:hypothetical protein
MIEGAFNKKFITFSGLPQLESVSGETLKEKVKNLENAHWEMNTNIQKVFELILTNGKMFNVSQENMPELIFLFSDMQFDEATNNEQTNFEAIREQYANAGYLLPKIVFWNLRGNSKDFPVVKDTENTLLISGFSADILELILNKEEITPMLFLRKILDGERYSRVKVADEQFKINVIPPELHLDHNNNENCVLN